MRFAGDYLILDSNEYSEKTRKMHYIGILSWELRRIGVIDIKLGGMIKD